MTEEIKKTLVERLKERGLVITEEAVAQVVEELFVVADEEIDKLDAAYAPLIKVAIPQVKGLVMGFVDKIDGNDDNR